MSCIQLNDLVAKPVKYEIAGGYVNIVQMMAKDVIDIQKQKEQLSDFELAAKVVSQCVVDDEGKPIATFEQALQLAPTILSELFLQCHSVSGFKSDDTPKN